MSTYEPLTIGNCRSLRSLDSQKLRFCLPVSLIVRQKHMSRVQLVEIDLRAITSAEELHSLLMESLNFPGWYGANWDAFWDAITGLVEMPCTVRFLGWPQFSQRLPREAVLLKECLTEMQGEYPQLASKVVYA